MNTLLVTSTDDGIGKTAITLALALRAQEAGYDVGYMKPKGTRLQSAVGKTRDEDPLLARELLDLDAELHEMEPIVYSPTFIQEAIRGREDPDELREQVVEHFEALSEEKDLMIVEGSGALSTGGIVDLTDIDIAEAIDARVLLVSGYNSVATTDEVLASAQTIGDRLSGIVFNAVADAKMDELNDDVMPFLDGKDAQVFGALPSVQELAGVTVEELARSLGCDVLTPEVDLQSHIERFTVGAMGGNSALDQFRRTRDAVMVAGGDRSEIQTAALEAAGIKVLLLTGGFRPASAVLGSAQEQGIPILLVQSDTRTTIDRIENLLHSGRTRNEETVDRMGELLEESVDVERILSLGL